MKTMPILFICISILTAPLFSEPSLGVPFDSAPVKKKEVAGEITLENGKKVQYTATAGTIDLRDEQNKPKSEIFYISYVVNDEKEKNRPVVYCFNGGPGSSSVWLHLGAFGPKRVIINGTQVDLPPYQLVDNPYCLLDQADFVFIDPISTGYSKTVDETDPKKYHGVTEDVKIVAEFIRIWTTQNKRWDSPKVIVGESYGSTRAGGLANYLHYNHHMYLNGVALISPILNFQTILDPSKGNDLPYPLLLPSLTATAWYHKRLAPDLQKRALADLLGEVVQFADTEYLLALAKGDDLAPEVRGEVVNKLALFTGLNPEYIERANLRVNVSNFAIELLRQEGKTVGRLDGRFVIFDADKLAAKASEDPTFNAIFGAYTAAFNEYISTVIGWQTEQEYKTLANLFPWSYGKDNEFLNVSLLLREVMLSNPRLKVFVASGVYDMATPFWASRYTINHLNLPKELRGNITEKRYLGGHMMYIDEGLLKQLSGDMRQFFTEVLQKP